jgi:hypothetical protein
MVPLEPLAVPKLKRFGPKNLRIAVPPYVYRVMRAAKQGTWQPFTPAPAKKAQSKSLDHEVVERIAGRTEPKSLEDELADLQARSSNRLQ